MGRKAKCGERKGNSCDVAAIDRLLKVVHVHVNQIANEKEPFRLLANLLGKKLPL
jgi:hypothetical protein